MGSNEIPGKWTLGAGGLPFLIDSSELHKRVPFFYIISTQSIKKSLKQSADILQPILLS